MATAGTIFINHASADRKVADLLRDTLVLGGIAREWISWSSSRATGILVAAERSHVDVADRCYGLDMRERRHHVTSTDGALQLIGLHGPGAATRKRKPHSRGRR